VRLKWSKYRAGAGFPRLDKDKFCPQWEPRYFVYPGGFKLPRILADVAALVAGGYRKVLLR